MNEKWYNLAEGKYTLIRDEQTYKLAALRNGEPWVARNKDLIGDNLVHSLLNEIDSLQEMLRWYIEEDEIHEGDPENQYWIDGKHKAMKLLGMEIEE